MGFISKKKSKIVIPSDENKNIERQYAKEIVEIFEEKLDELNVSLPGVTKNSEDEERSIKTDLKNELVSEIEDFLCLNQKVYVNIA